MKEINNDISKKQIQLMEMNALILDFKNKLIIVHDNYRELNEKLFELQINLADFKHKFKIFSEHFEK